MKPSIRHGSTPVQIWVGVVMLLLLFGSTAWGARHTPPHTQTKAQTSQSRAYQRWLTQTRQSIGLKAHNNHVPMTVPKLNCGQVSSQPQTTPQKIDINLASNLQLQALPGIGPTKAQAIIEYRQSRPFRRTRELQNVTGIGAKTMARLKHRICTKPRDGPTTKP